MLGCVIMRGNGDLDNGLARMSIIIMIGSKPQCCIIGMQCKAHQRGTRHTSTWVEFFGGGTVCISLKSWKI